jgi:hypothetical protein
MTLLSGGTTPWTPRLWRRAAHGRCGIRQLTYKKQIHTERLPRGVTRGSRSASSVAIALGPGLVAAGHVARPAGGRALREAGAYALAGLTARMVAECIPGAASAVNVTDASANPAAASPSRYSRRERAPAMHPTYDPAATRSACES